MKKLLYVECKATKDESHCANNGNAWIGYGDISKSGKTLYFNGNAFTGSKGRQKSFKEGDNSDYWISGPKMYGSDRLFGGNAKIFIDRDAVKEYMALRGLDKLPKNFEVIIFESNDLIKEKVNKAQNVKLNG